MKKSINVFLWLIAGVVVLSLAAVLMVANLDPNRYKSFINETVSKKLNRSFEIRGDLDVTFYPWLGIKATDMVLANATGFGDEPMARIGMFAARVKTWGLLTGRYEIDTARLHNADFRLARSADGKSNFDTLLAAPGETPGETPDTKPGNEQQDRKPVKSLSDSLGAVLLGGLDVQNLNLAWDDRSGGERYDIDGFNLATGQVALGKPLDIRGSFHAKSSRPALAGDVTLSGTLVHDLAAARYRISPLTLAADVKAKQLPGGSGKIEAAADIAADLKTNTLSVNKIDAKSMDTRIAGDLAIKNFMAPSPAVSADLDMRGKDLSLWFRALDIQPLASQLAGVKDRSFDLRLKADADTAAGRVIVPELSVGLVGADIRGNVTLEQIHTGNPAVKLKISAKGPDLPFLLQVAGQLQGRDAGLASLGRRISGMQKKAFSLETRMDADLSRGRLDIPELTFDSLGIRLDTRVQAANINTPQPSVKGALDVAGPDLPLVLEMAGYLNPRDPSLKNLGKQLGSNRQKAFKVQAGFDVSLEKGQILIPQLSAAALGVTAAGSLAGRNLGTATATLDGGLSVRADDVKGLLTAMGQKDLAAVLKSVDFETKMNIRGLETRLSPLSVSAVFSGKQIPNSPVPLTLSADTTFNYTKQTFALDGLQLKGLGLDLKGRMSATQIRTAPAFKGDIHLARFSPGEFMKKVNLPLPKTADATVFKTAALETAFAGTKDSLQLEGLKLLLDQTTLTGSLGVGHFAAPDIRFSLAVNTLNLDRYLPPRSPKAKKAATPGTAAAGAAEVFPVKTLRALKLAGDFKAGQLTVSNAKLARVSARISARDGDIRLSPVSASLYGGSYQGEVLLDARGSQPILKLTSSLKNVQAEPLLTDVTGKARIRGTGDVTADLSTAGNTEAAMKRNLNGRMAFAFKNGAIKGYNIGKLLRSLKSLKENLSFNVSDKEETDFTALTGNPVVKSGVVRVDDLSGKSPALRLSGKGVAADLVNEQIDYLANATVVETSKGQAGKELADLNGVTIPVYIKGALNNPKIQPDIKALLSKLATQDITKDITKKLGIQLPGQASSQDATGKTPATSNAEPEEVLKKSLEKGLDNLFKKLTQ